MRGHQIMRQTKTVIEAQGYDLLRYRLNVCLAKGALRKKKQ